jgi:hypothetical protein
MVLGDENIPMLNQGRNGSLTFVIDSDSQLQMLRLSDVLRKVGLSTIAESPFPLPSSSTIEKESILFVFTI